VEIHPVEQYLYIANIIIILVFAAKLEVMIVGPAERKGAQLVAFGLIIVTLVIAAAIMINTHEELKGSQVRFPQ